MFENPRRGRLARNFAKNVQKILDLKSSFEQIFSENYIVVGCPWQTPSESANHNNFFGDFCGDSFKTWKSRSNLSSVNHVLPCHLLQQTVTGNSLLNTVANNSLRKHPFLLALLGTSSVWNFCRWVADVPPRETSPAAKSEEKRMFSLFSEAIANNKPGPLLLVFNWCKKRVMPPLTY